MVQFPRSSCRCCKSGIYHFADDTSNRCHAHCGEWRVNICAVSAFPNRLAIAYQVLQRSISDRSPGYLRALHVWHNLLISYQLVAPHHSVVCAYQQYVIKEPLAGCQLTIAQSSPQSASASRFSFSHRTNKAHNGSLQQLWTALVGVAGVSRFFSGSSILQSRLHR